MSVAAHAQAFLSLLDADIDGPPDLVRLDGKVPNGTVPPYVLVYFSDNRPELAESQSLTGASERYVLRGICHCVGGSAAAARTVADRVERRLLDAAPAVAGRTCFPIRREEGQPADTDETTLTTAVDLVVVYRLESVPG